MESSTVDDQFEKGYTKGVEDGRRIERTYMQAEWELVNNSLLHANEQIIDMEEAMDKLVERIEYWCSDEEANTLLVNYRAWKEGQK